MHFKIEGTTKDIEIDMNKLKEAITYLDAPVEEKQASAEDSLTKVEHIDYKDLTEEQFLDKIVTAVGEIEKHENKTFKKDSVIKIFKYAGDFA